MEVDGAAASVPLLKWKSDFSRTFQYYLDKSTPHATGRWLGTAGMAAIYFLRVYFIQGFYIITYGLGIYLLNLLIGFLSPLADPELEGTDEPALPTKGSDEFKPFVRRLPEFKFWYSITKAFCVAFVMTFFSVFDVPVFWPILLFYWIVLFFLTMKRQIVHMIKYKYVPFSMGKQVLSDLSVEGFWHWAGMTTVSINMEKKWLEAERTGKGLIHSGGWVIWTLFKFDVPDPKIDN